MKVVIIGGVAGGASAAARLRRLDEQAEILLFERGEYISFANCGLPYYIGGTIQKRNKLLLQTPESMKERFNVEVRVQCEVTAIDRARKVVTVLDLTSGKTYEERYDKLVLSPGAAPMRPDFLGSMLPNVFTLRNMADCDAIKGYLTESKPARALVVGGGFIGVEMVENLVHAGVDVTAIELADQVLAPLDYEMACMVHQNMRAHGVDLRLSTGLEAIEQEGASLTCTLSGGVKVFADMVLLAIGVRADHALAQQAGLELDIKGSIRVDEHMATSDPDIYAVGDAVAVSDFVSGEKAVLPLAGPANRQGRMVADLINGREASYEGTQGTMICKVFDLSVGATGNNEKQLRASGRAYDKVYVHPSSHAGYYPGAETLSLKLLFDPASGVILGAQAVGKEGVDKRIDVIATAMRGRMTVQDLEKLELCYAPPFSSAKDPVNMAGFTACNVMKGDLRQIFIEDLKDLDPEKDLLVDIRTQGEYDAGTIGNAVLIPLDSIRDRLAEFPKDKRVVIFCRAGLRGYIGYRILVQNGITNVYNLSGGYLTWEPVYGAKNKSCGGGKTTRIPKEKA